MDVLKEHPDLAPNVLKVLSDALKASQQQVHELERRLAEQTALSSSLARTLSVEVALGGENIRLATAVKKEESDRNSIQSACCDENRGKITQLESDLSRLRLDYEHQVSRNTDISATVTTAERNLARLQSEHEKEKSSGDELRAALEKRYLDLRNKETAVETRSLTFAQEVATFKRDRDQWSRKESEQEQVINTLAAQYDIAEKQRDVLQAMLTEKTSALEAQEDALKRVIRNNLRESQELTQKLNKTNHRLQQAETHQGDSQLALEQLMQQVNVVRIENEKYKRDIQTLLTASELERQSRFALEKTVEGKDGEITQYRAENTRLEEKFKGLAEASKEHLDKLTESLESERAQNDELHDKFIRSRERCAELKGLLLQSDLTITRLREDISRLEAEGTRMANHTEMLRDDLLEQLDRQKAKNRQLTGDYNDALRQCEKRETEYSALDATHEAALSKLRDENKNLRTSVLTAASQAREQFQRAAEHEQGLLQDVIKTHKEENSRLQKELDSLGTQNKDLGHQVAALLTALVRMLSPQFEE